jgi:hypothetical protein
MRFDYRAFRGNIRQDKVIGQERSFIRKKSLRIDKKRFKTK